MDVRACVSVRARARARGIELGLEFFSELSYVSVSKKNVIEHNRVS